MGIPILLLVLSCLLEPGQAKVKQHQSRPSEAVCERWRFLVDPSGTGGLPSPDVEHLTDEEALVGLSCLLMLEANRGEGKFSGATRFEVSQLFPQATVELDALFVISAIYNQSWRHADGVALADARGKIQNAVSGPKRAFPFVRRWYDRIQRLGLVKARSQGDDPLKGSGLHWY